MGGTSPSGAYAQTGLTGSGGVSGAGTSLYGGSPFGSQGMPATAGPSSSNPFDWTSAFSGTPPTPAAPTPGTPGQGAAPQWGQGGMQPPPLAGEQYMTTDPNSVNFNRQTWAPPAAPAAAPAPAPAAAAAPAYTGPTIGYPGQLRDLYAGGGVDQMNGGKGYIVMPDGTTYLNPFAAPQPFGTASNPINPYAGMGGQQGAGMRM